MKSNLQIDYLFVTNSATGGGAERSINTTVRELQRLGVPVGILNINSGPEDSVVIKINRYCLNRPYNSGLISTLRKGFEFRKLVAKLSPKVLILNCDLPEFYGAFFTRKKQIICVEHVSQPWVGRKALGLITRLILNFKKSKWIVVNSYLTPWPLKKLEFSHLPNPISNINFLSNLVLPKEVNEVRRLVYIGRLSENQKRTSWVVRIAAETQIPLIMVGNGDSKSNLLKLAKSLKVRASILDHQKNPWSILLPGDLLVVPSAWEGDGMVAVEAIIGQIPIILSDIKEFRFFDLEEKHYAKSIKDFVESINKHKDNLHNFTPQTFISNRFRESRNPRDIAIKWHLTIEKMIL